MKIISYNDVFKTKLIPLIAQNAISLAKLKNREKEVDFEAANEDLEYYLRNKFPFFLAIDDDNKILGFTVCRIDENVVWDELLYVIPEERRKGIASALFKRAEQVAIELGGDTLYNWVHPNNEKIIPFLKKQGYEVLNFIEIRKKYPNETLTQRMKVGKHEYKY
jgi:ribosomal protein S18 acetylase RimI-like enzyme